MNLRRVAITGIGVVTPLGSDKELFFKRLCAGENAITRIEAFDTEAFSVKIAGEIKDFDISPYVHPRDSQRMDRFCQFGLVASILAFEDANITLDETDKERFGVILGSGIGGTDTFAKEVIVLHDKGPARVSPIYIPKMIGNIGAAQVAIRLGAKGITSDPVTACATGTNAIGEAYHRIKFGMEDFMLAGGAEAAINPISLSGFANMKALSKQNDYPERASRPFDLNRDGFVIGEGSGVLFLEEWEHAVQRKAPIYAEIVGYGCSSDAYHITLPEPSGISQARCMQKAIEEANITLNQITYINAHGTSTPANDATETRAIRYLFHEHASSIHIHSTKSMIGHLLGAAGGVEAAVVAMTLKTGKIHPTINLENPDPECDLDYTPQKMIMADCEYALSNSFGFGGHNFSICLKKVS